MDRIVHSLLAALIALPAGVAGAASGIAVVDRALQAMGGESALRGVRQRKLDIERFAAGHGSTGVFAELVAIVEKTAPRSSLAPFVFAAGARP